MSEPRRAEPFPSPLVAGALTSAALFVLWIVVSLIAGGKEASQERFTLALAFGYAVAFGGLGSFAASFIPAPADVRLGLRPFPVRAALPVLLLLPAVLLYSELDNWIRMALGASQPSELGEPQAAAIEFAMFFVLLRPVVEEFFFRGVLLQGCASALGAARGVLLVALFQGVMGAALGRADLASALSACAQAFAGGALLGFVRIATGSVLPPIALSTGIAAVGLAATTYPDVLPIAGFNAPGSATPLGYLMPALGSAALAGWMLRRTLATQPPLPPIPPARREEDQEPGPFF